MLRRLLLILVPFLLPAAELRLGRAAVKITPPVGVPMGGSYATRISEGLLDDLFAKALVFDLDGTRAAIVACDLVALNRAVVDQTRRLIEKQTGLRPEQVLLSATHTHSGPLISGSVTRDDVYGGNLDISKQYLATLPSSIAESVRLASSAMAPAHVWAAKAQESSVSFNRRFWMKDGSVGWNPGKLNPNIVRPAGPIDSEVAVVYFDSPDSTPLAAYVNHALHVAVTSGRRFSADYPATIARLLGDVKGPDLVTLFTIGAAGNVNHINVQSKTPQSGPREAARIGSILAATVLKAFDRLEPLAGAPLQFRSQAVRLPLAEAAPGDLEAARLTAALAGGPSPPRFLDTVRAFKALDVAERNGRPLETEVQVITLGDQLAFVGLPGEIFVELGLALKRASPFPHTIVAELAGASIGYVPDRKAYAEGNYEPVSARCGPGSGELLVETATRLLIDMHARSRPALQ